ncbi:MAG: hypothetical protein H6723_18855 [Sandaracinus sp.]|nr:hypothetical protein [Sandaracinus sp.]
MLEDFRLPRFIKGWMRQEIRSRGSSRIRNVPGYELAHRRGREAAKGFDHLASPSMPQLEELHGLQHHFDDFGRRSARSDVFVD